MAWYTPLPHNEPPSKFSCVLTILAAGQRAAHSCDKVGNNLFIFGGWNGKKALNDLYTLELD